MATLATKMIPCQFFIMFVQVRTFDVDKTKNMRSLNPEGKHIYTVLVHSATQPLIYTNFG